MQIIAKIDLTIYRRVTPNITTDEVVLTAERIEHIKANHPNDYEQYCGYMRAVLEQPDYILADQPKTALVLKHFCVDDVKFRLVLRLHAGDDVAGYKNSVLTFMKTNDKKWKQNVKNKKILYSRK